MNPTPSTDQTEPAVPQTGQPGERWGGFVFASPGSSDSVTQTPAPSGHIPDEELIPSAHPGTSVVASASAVRDAGKVPAALVVVPTFVPSGYRLIGVYTVEAGPTGVVDYALAYAKDGSPGPTATVFLPDLWVGWTTRAPQPLPVSTAQNVLGDGRRGEPYKKVQVRGFEGVFAEWTNPQNINRSLRINSGLVWFDESGRQWWVHAPEPFAVLEKVAASLEPVK